MDLFSVCVGLSLGVVGSVLGFKVASRIGRWARVERESVSHGVVWQ